MQAKPQQKHTGMLVWYVCVWGGGDGDGGGGKEG